MSSVDQISVDRSGAIEMTPGRRKSVSLSLLVAAVVSYAYWLTHGTFQLISWSASGADPNSLLFNSMLEHLVHGRFDVDPAIVGVEGFVRDGRVYADWGVFPAFVRVPLLFFRGGLELDVTCLSSLLAVATAATMKFNTLHVTFRNAASSNATALYWALLLTLLFGGAQVEFLKPSVYQEACLWAGALGACFVFLTIRGVLAGNFSVGRLCGMAAMAGFALLTRAPIGVGLCLSVVLLLLVNQWKAGSIVGPIWKSVLEFVRDLRLSRSVVLPATVLLVFALLAGFVNYERWGNPLVFADYHRYFYYMHRFPDRLVRLQQYGLLNPARIPFAVIYYFVPIWVLQRADGHQLFQEHETRLFDAVELPPSSFLLTDALLLMLLAFAVWILAKQSKIAIRRNVVVAVAAGLSVSGLLIMSFGVLSFRYRIDFYPFIEFGAFVGAALLLQSQFLAKSAIRRGLLIAAAISVFTSHLELMLYKISELGSAVGYAPGLLEYYIQHLGPHLSRFHFWAG
jgi:hypothetical protein